MPHSLALQRYNRRLGINALIYAVILIAATYGYKHHLMSDSVTVAAALCLALSLIGNFVAVGVYLAEERDEYLRMLMTQRTLWTSGAALAIATIWGYLESFGIVGAPAAFEVCLIWYGGLGLGSLATLATRSRAE